MCERGSTVCTVSTELNLTLSDFFGIQCGLMMFLLCDLRDVWLLEERAIDRNMDEDDKNVLCENL